MAITINYTPEEEDMFRAYAVSQKIKVEEFIRQTSVKALRNAEYLAMLDRSEKELHQGRVVTKTMDELEAMAAE